MTSATTTTSPSTLTTPEAGPPQTPGMSSTTRGTCSLTFQDRVFQFRTNPNEIWWSYKLLTSTQDTYGGRVVQLLGTRLGDLQVKVDCGDGGWPYLTRMVSWLRELLSDQRNGNPAVFEYTTRNWKMYVYGLSIPFQDEVEATVREITLNFKIQEDITGTLSQLSLNAELARLKDGVYGPGYWPHNQFDDGFAKDYPGAGLDPPNPSGPAYTPSGITNSVDSSLAGDWNLGGIPTGGGLLGFLPSIPGVGSIFGGF